MKSDRLQGIIIPKGPSLSVRVAPARYKKITVISVDSDYQASNGRLSNADLIKILNKLRPLN